MIAPLVVTRDNQVGREEGAIDASILSPFPVWQPAAMEEVRERGDGSSMRRDIYVYIYIPLSPSAPVSIFLSHGFTAADGIIANSSLHLPLPYAQTQINT